MFKSLNEENEAIKGMPDDYLANAASGGPTAGNRFLAAIELSRRNRLRRRALAMAGDSVDRGPVLAQLQQEAARLRAPQGYSGGGLVRGYAGGGAVTHSPLLDEIARRERRRLAALAETARPEPPKSTYQGIIPDDLPQRIGAAHSRMFDPITQAVDASASSFSGMGDEATGVESGIMKYLNDKLSSAQKAVGDRISDSESYVWRDRSKDPETPFWKRRGIGFRVGPDQTHALIPPDDPYLNDGKLTKKPPEEYGALFDPPTVLPPEVVAEDGDLGTGRDAIENIISQDTGDSAEYSRSILDAMGLGDPGQDPARQQRLSKAVALGMMSKAFADNPTFIGGFGNAAAAGAAQIAQGNEQAYQNKLRRRQAILDQYNAELAGDLMDFRRSSFGEEMDYKYHSLAKNLGLQREQLAQTERLTVSKLDAANRSSDARVYQSNAASIREAVKLASSSISDPTTPIGEAVYQKMEAAKSPEERLAIYRRELESLVQYFLEVNAVEKQDGTNPQAGTPSQDDSFLDFIE